MKRKPRVSRSKRAHDPGTPLDATALEAIERFVRVLSRSGTSRLALERAFMNACARLPKTRPAGDARAQRELSNASHVLTVWFSDPLYLARDGSPLRLPVRGTAPSIESLVARVDRSLDVDELVDYLRRTNALRRHGSRYTPRQRALSLRGAQGPEAFRDLRGLLGMLSTLEHNHLPKEAAPSWFEYFAENPNFPKRARALLDGRLDKDGMELLHKYDALMHRQELKRRPGEPTVRMGIGIYRFEEEVPVSAARGKGRSRP